MIKEYPNIGSGDLHITVLKAICGSVQGKSMLDLCAGEAPTTRQLGFTKRTYVDVVARDMGDESQHAVTSDVKTFLERCDHYDVSIMLDGIEHFRFPQGYELISLMEAKSDKQILFTPYGEYMVNGDMSDVHPDSHKSGWTPDMLPGYACLVFPQFHPTLSHHGLGAFYAWKCPSIAEDFLRVVEELRL